MQDGSQVSVPEEIDMDQAEEFRRACRLHDTVLAQQEDGPVEFGIDSADRSTLLAALEYYRLKINPSSGDVLIRTEFDCPACGQTEGFRAQSGHVTEIPHPEQGFEVWKIDGITQCDTCGFHSDVVQFEPVGLDSTDETAWTQLYERTYRTQEQVTPLHS